MPPFAQDLACMICPLLQIAAEGRDAEAFSTISRAEMSVPVGKIVYTQFLNHRGGIEADVTVTRLSETAYLVVTLQQRALPMKHGYVDIWVITKWSLQM